MMLQGLAPQKVAWFRDWVFKKNFLEVVDLHCQLTEAVRKHYRLRNHGNHLLIAVSACEYLISISDIAMDAMIAKAHYKIYEYEQIIGQYPYPKKFYRPSHIGYDQLGVLLRRYKQPEREKALTNKMMSEGWRGGEVNLSEFNGRHFLHNNG